MLCNNGHENADGVRFCGACGANMGANPGAPTSPGFSPTQATVSGPSFQTLKLDLLNELAKTRLTGHPTTLQSVLTMVSGLLFALAALVVCLYAVGNSESDNPYPAGLVWVILGCIVSYVVVKFVDKDLVQCATTAFVPMSIMAALLIFGSQIEEGKIGAALLVAGLISLAAWFFPILRGRPALLASGILMTSFGLLVLMVQSSIAGAVDCGYEDDCFADPASILTTTSQKSATLMLVFGIVLLAIAWVLDRRDWPQIGKIFIGIGIVFEIGGAFGVFESSNDKTAASILLVLAGLLLVVVAVQRSRKSSLVIGGLGAALGITAFVWSITQDNETPVLFAILMILASFGIGYLALKKNDVITNSIQKR